MNMLTVVRELVENVSFAQVDDVNSVTKSLLGLLGSHQQFAVVASLKAWSHIIQNSKCMQNNILSRIQEINEQLSRTKSDDVTVTAAVDTVPPTYNANQQNSVDPKYVQLLGDKTAIEEKISKFINFKQMQNDKANIQEFCGGACLSSCADADDDSSSARTRAVYHPRRGCSRVAVTRVVNQYGPQTANSGTHNAAQYCHASHAVSSANVSYIADRSIATGISERLASMETHVKLYAENEMLGRPVPADVYERIQNLEDRILQLESTSPEYFDMLSAHSRTRRKQPKMELLDMKSLAAYKNLSTAEVDNKIGMLKRTLTGKMQ